MVIDGCVLGSHPPCIKIGTCLQKALVEPQFVVEPRGNVANMSLSRDKYMEKVNWTKGHLVIFMAQTSGAPFLHGCENTPDACIVITAMQIPYSTVSVSLCTEMALTHSENDCSPIADQHTYIHAHVVFSLLITEGCSHIYKHVQMRCTVESVTHSLPRSLLMNESLMFSQSREITNTLWDLLPSGLYFISSLISQHRPQSQCLDHLYHYCCYDLTLTDWMLVSGSLH